MPSQLTVNDRQYDVPPVCAIAICLDGCEPAYLDAAIEAGLMPTLKRIREQGTDRLAHSVIPSFTNPNNMSIATGRPPAVHGICGNFLYDPDTGEEVMMNDPKFLRAPTIFSAFYNNGQRVAIVTAKDKLRALLADGMAFDDNRAICFSSERANQTTPGEHGIDNAANWLGMEVPEVYSAALSEFVFAAGIKLLREFKPDVMYLTTTDYIQHKHAPGDTEANSFYANFDKYLTELDAEGAAIVITADHGMKPKHHADGSPNVIYVQDLLDEWLGKDEARLILPITDPYVVHHGALGSFGTAYLPVGADQSKVIDQLLALDGIDVVLDKVQACKQYDLPPDRIGDIVIISGENVTVGTSEHRHDLAALDVPLRSHGGLTEQTVPFIVNRPMQSLATAPELRNFDIINVACQAAQIGNS
ncbi:MAG: phosphonoacetate hydrolase [Granulosicoccus sp.]